MSDRVVVDLIINYLLEERKLVYATVALSTAALYDHITTLDEELEFIWFRRSKITVVQALFVINRYLGEAILLYTCASMLFNMDISPKRRCHNPMEAIVWGGSTVVWAMQGIMAFRISSMYLHKRAIIATLCTSLAVEVIVVIMIQAIAFTRVMPSPIPPYVPVCRLAQSSAWFWYYWMAVFCLETLLLSLSFCKALQYCGGLDGIKSSFLSSTRHKSLTYVLFRDSITFPFIAISVCLVNFIGVKFLSPTSVQITIFISLFMARILGCRLVLNLREAYYGAFGDEIGQEMVVPISFAPLSTG